MAQILGIKTVNEKLIYEVDQDPSAGAGTPAPIGSMAMLETGTSQGEMYLKIGALDTAWDKMTTATTGTNVALGAFRRLAIYSTDANGYQVDDQIQQNSQDVDVIIEAQGTRTAGITYQIPNPGDAVTGADFVLTEGVQLINGDKTFGNNVVVNGNLTVEGAVNNINTTNTNVEDKLITLNKNGAAGSAGESGIEFEEDGSITSYFKTNAGRNGFIWKAPGVAGVSEFISTAADQTYNLPDEDGRFILQDSVAAGVIQQIPFWSSDEKLTNETGSGVNSFTWDTANKRLGIQTTAPVSGLDVRDDIRTTADILVQGEADYRIDQGVVTTNDASFTTIKTVSIPTDSMVLVESKVLGRKTGGSGSGNTGDGSAYVRIARLKNIGGTVTLGDVEASYTDEDIKAFNIRYEVSGTNVNIQVRGSANNNVNWEGTFKVKILD